MNPRASPALARVRRDYRRFSDTGDFGGCEKLMAMSIAVMVLLGLIFCLAVALAVVNLQQASRMRRRPNADHRTGPKFYEHNARPKDDRRIRAAPR